MNDDNNKNKKKEQSDEELLKNVTGSEYKYGFVSDIDTHVIPVGLNEDVVRYISKVKGEPEWLLDFRLKAFSHWKTMTMPSTMMRIPYSMSDICHGDLIHDILSVLA